MALKKCPIEYFPFLLFCYAYLYSKHHNLNIFHCFEKWFAPLQSWKNKLSFGIYKSLVWWHWHEPCFRTFTSLRSLIYQNVLIKFFPVFVNTCLTFTYSLYKFQLGVSMGFWDMYSYVVIYRVLYQNPIQYCTHWSQIHYFRLAETQESLIKLQECTHKQLQVVKNACNASLSLYVVQQFEAARYHKLFLFCDRVHTTILGSTKDRMTSTAILRRPYFEKFAR